MPQQEEEGLYLVEVTLSSTVPVWALSRANAEAVVDTRDVMDDMNDPEILTFKAHCRDGKIISSVNWCPEDIIYSCHPDEEMTLQEAINKMCYGDLTKEEWEKEQRVKANGQIELFAETNEHLT